MSVYWPYPKQASDCLQRDLRYLVNPRARSSALAALGTLQPMPSGLLNTVDPWTQSLTYVYLRRKKQARSNKQQGKATQHTWPKAVTSQKKRAASSEIQTHDTPHVHLFQLLKENVLLYVHKYYDRIKQMIVIIIFFGISKPQIWHIDEECRGFESHPRQLIFRQKSDCLGCAVLLCLVVCLTLLASFFLLISH